MNIGAPELLIILISGTFIIVPICGIIDAALKPNSIWAEANQSKIVWILLQVLLSVVGTVIYLAAIRPKLTTAAAGIDAIRLPSPPST